MPVDAVAKIVVAGFSFNGTSNDMSLWRYNSNMTLDTGFNTTGYATHNSAAGGNGIDEAESLLIDANAKILVAGFSFNGSDEDIALWRYNSNGTLDTGFNTVGYLTHDNAAGGNGNDEGKALALDKKSKIILGGYSTSLTGKDMALWRYDDGGTLDTSFNGIGYLSHDSAAGGFGDDTGNAVALDASENIVIAGRSNNGVNDDMVIWRYK